MRGVKPDLRVWVRIGVLLAVGIMASTPGVIGQKALARSTHDAASTARQPPGTPDAQLPTARPDHATTVSAAKRLSVPDLAQKASGGRMVPVIVGFDAAFVPEGWLTPARVATQRQGLAAAGAAILAQLLRGSASNVKRFATVPYFAAQVDADALQVLGGLQHVTSIVEDVREPPTLSDSTTIIQANQVWNGGLWGAGVTGTGWNVAVLDTGVDKTHEMFAGGKVVSEACYSTTGGGSTSVCPGGSNSTAAGSGVNCSSSLGDGCKHGTHVAGIAAGSASGLEGVAPGAGVMAIQVFSAFDASTCGGSPCVLSWTSDQILGLERVLALSGSGHIASVNMSLGAGKYTSAATCDAANGARKAAIDNLRSVNIPTVIASGNNGHADGMSAPGCISTAVAVGSTTKSGAVASFSDMAPGMIELLAPGFSIRSAVPGNTYESWNGTSMAAPHVAGAWALLKAVAALKGNAGSVTAIQSALHDTGKAIVHAGSGGTYREIRIHDAAVQVYNDSGGSAPSGAGVFIAGASPPPPTYADATVSAQETLVQWEAAIDMNPEQTRLAQANAFDMAAGLQVQGVAASINNNQLVLSGGQGIEQLRSALFDGAAGWVDFLGGPVELTLALPAGNAPVTLQMEARTTTGYRWEVAPTAADVRYSQSGEPTFARRYRALGAPSIQTIRLQAVSTSDSAVRLRYQRPFETDTPTHARLSVRVTGASDVIELSDPTPTEPPAADANRVSTERSPYAELQPMALPASWDWRPSGIVPDVRDQGSCGGCWAFGTVGIMESAIKKSNGPLTDLSEQFLISCNRDGWNCGDGGWTAHKYHYDTLGKNQTTVGAVLESAKPYTATDGTCTVTLSHPYKLDSWQFITGSESTMPTVDQIKNAIYTYGPVTAGVCTDSGWDHYSGGVYNPRSNQCDGSTDHQIILVGWDDATSSWILRNSWGSGWGERGYMHIQWDTTGTKSRVGEGTSWVRYQGVSSTVPGAPSGLTASVSGSNVALAWRAPGTGGAPTAYTVEAGSSSGLANLAAFSTGNTATTFASSGVGNGIYYLRVKATNSFGTSAASNEVIMVVGADGCTSPPGAPGGLAITQNSGGNIAVRWSAAPGGPTTYFLEAGSSPGLADLASIDLGGTGTTFSTAGVNAGFFWIRVRAANACGRSEASNEVMLIVQ